MTAEIRRLGLDVSFAAAGFESQAENALCPICHDYLEDPKQTDCEDGHVFCGPCIQRIFDERKPCPCCRGNFTKLERPQALTRNFIEQVKWKCLNFESGCPFTEPKKQLEKHLDDECPEQETECPFDGCTEKMKRGPLTEHKATCGHRLIPCNHCENEVPFNAKEAHLGVCLKFPVPCPNNCGETPPRGAVSEHVADECPDGVQDCPISGCGERIKRKEMDEHDEQSMRKHIKLLHRELTNIKVDDALEVTVRFPDFDAEAAYMEKDEFMQSLPFVF
uniref:RING-type domain-containing protein n=1 Tax=Chromera velia CCMP2878 TaxID=1169474 RepID=A0A0G4G8N2_9ALVE|eukprot:Cvel_20775.t1-p1 / transcript=Cvel_20775.t1 / gene=Cvel_20775 / organism=Chromera_velia_CCMP2878 / gene_product=TNF receptor-associated factor 5, putative / transcript_product=TNF receptor-associated factor 5, putative / location=Cvel_scaffold1895:35971-37074(-) / protein_length=276 / sequence_SO=supercontig / SO=protein_coding / is_pseudo=false